MPRFAGRELEKEPRDRPPRRFPALPLPSRANAQSAQKTRLAGLEPLLRVHSTSVLGMPSEIPMDRLTVKWSSPANRGSHSVGAVGTSTGEPGGNRDSVIE